MTSKYFCEEDIDKLKDYLKERYDPENRYKLFKFSHSLYSQDIWCLKDLLMDKVLILGQKGECNAFLKRILKRT